MAKRTSTNARISKYTKELRESIDWSKLYQLEVGAVSIKVTPYPVSGPEWEVSCEVRCSVLTLSIRERGVKDIHSPPLWDGTIGRFSPQAVAGWFVLIAEVIMDYRKKIFFRAYHNLTDDKSYIRFRADYCYWNHEEAGEARFEAVLEQAALPAYIPQRIASSGENNPQWLKPMSSFAMSKNTQTPKQIKDTIDRFNVIRLVYAIVATVATNAD